MDINLVTGWAVVDCKELLDDLDTAQGFFHQAILPKMRQALPENERQGAGFNKKKAPSAMFVIRQERLPSLQNNTRSTWKWMGWKTIPFGMASWQVRTVSFRECGYFPSINLFGGYYVMFNLGSVDQEGWGSWSYWWFEWMRAKAKFRVFEIFWVSIGETV